MYDKTLKKSIVICKQHNSEYGLVGAAHMDISEAVDEFSTQEGRAKIEEAQRNKGKSVEELPFKTQGLFQSAEYVARSYRPKAGLNKEEWEFLHEQGMTLKNPGDAHPVCWALKEDGSGEFEKLWLYNWCPCSGYRTVEFGSAMTTSLNTPILEPCRHLYKDQGLDASRHVSKKTREELHAGCNEPGHLSDSIRKHGGPDADNAVHPLGYCFSDLPK